MQKLFLKKPLLLHCQLTHSLYFNGTQGDFLAVTHLSLFPQILIGPCVLSPGPVPRGIGGLA